MSSGQTSQAVFFGTGPVAAASLNLLVKHTVVEVVVTKPTAAHHRQQAPVAELAKRLGLPLVFANSKTELDQAVSAANFSSSYAVLIDFGIIVSQQVIDSFKYGIINSHFSLLPKLRGADPISFSILEGHNQTGVSLMLIDQGMDTGQLLAQASIDLDGSETTPSLTDSLVELSDHLLQDYLPKYLAGQLTPYPQSASTEPTYSRKLSKNEADLDWTKPAARLEQEIRAFHGWPGSRTNLGDLPVIITKAAVGANTDLAPGALSITSNSLSVAAGDKLLIIESIKPAGKKEMPIQAFLAGYRSRLQNLDT